MGSIFFTDDRGMSATPYLIELSKRDGGPSVWSRLGFDLVDFMYEMVPPDADPGTEPIKVISRSTQMSELPDHLGDANGFHVVSDRMRSLMDAVVKDTRFHPATVELTKPGGRDTDIGGGPVVEGFWWMHCWRLLDIVAWNDSELTELGIFPSQYDGRNLTVRFATWEKLSIQSLPDDEHYFGVLGLKGGRRFLSPSSGQHSRQIGSRFLRLQCFSTTRVRSIAKLVRRRSARSFTRGKAGRRCLLPARTAGSQRAPE
jgi:hypothetical protein